MAQQSDLYIVCLFLRAACVCDTQGSTACDATSGACTCKVNVEQPDCSTCKVLKNGRDKAYTLRVTHATKEASVTRSVESYSACT